MHFKCINVDTPTSKSIMGKRVTYGTRNNKKANVLVRRAEREVKLKEKMVIKGPKDTKKYEDFPNDESGGKK